MTNKIILLALCWLFTSVSHALGYKNIKMGASYDETVMALKTEFGEPSMTDQQLMNYKNVELFGAKWDTVDFRFVGGKLAEVRCFSYQKNKSQAITRLNSAVQGLKKEYDMTCDYEEDGSIFYTGGVSPKGIGHLFTLFVSPLQGAWSTQLRFGPFRF